MCDGRGWLFRMHYIKKEYGQRIGISYCSPMWFCSFLQWFHFWKAMAPNVARGGNNATCGGNKAAHGNNKNNEKVVHRVR